MKLNVRKMALGALMYAPLPDVPGTRQPAEEPEEGVDQSLVQGMTGKVLSNDGYAFKEKLDEAEKFLQYAPEHIRNSPIGQRYKSMFTNWAVLNDMSNSKKIYDDILTDKKDAMSEFATFQGNVITVDRTSGDIVEMTTDEYAQNAQKYKALTNGEVMDLRQKDKRFAGRDDLFNFGRSAVSMNKITEEVRKALSNISTSTKGTTDVGYEEKEAAEGAKKILTTSTSGELFSSNANQLKAAGNAMWAMLDDSMKNVLRVRAIHSGYKPDQVEGAAMGLALGLLRQNLQTKEIVKDSETARKGLGAGSGDGANSGKVNPFTVMANFAGYKKNISFIVGPNSRADVVASENQILTDQQGNALGKVTFDDQNMNGLMTIADFGQVTVGDQHVPQEKLRGIVYEGKPSYSVLLPAKVDPVSKTIQPDFDKAQNFTDALKEIKKEGNLITKERKIQIYTEHGFDVDPTGEPAPLTLRPFIMIPDCLINNGVVKESPVVHFENNSYLEDYYSSIVGKKRDKYDDFVTPSPGYFPNTKVARVNVFIPMLDGVKQKAMFAGKTELLTDKEKNNISSFNTNTPGGNFGSSEIQQKLATNLSASSLNYSKQK